MQTPELKLWCLDGTTFVEESQWNVEIDCDDIFQEQARALHGVDRELCPQADLIKTTSGDFYLVWCERDPRRPSHEEFFADGERTDERCMEFAALCRKFPGTHKSKRVNRAEAFEVIALSYLPAEFFSDARVGSWAE